MFKLCDSDDAQLQEKQSCFDNTVLSLARSPNVKKVYVPKVNASNDIVVPLQLPDGFECKLCTMQWTWVTSEYRRTHYRLSRIKTKHHGILVSKYNSQKKYHIVLHPEYCIENIIHVVGTKKNKTKTKHRQKQYSIYKEQMLHVIMHIEENEIMCIIKQTSMLYHY